MSSRSDEILYAAAAKFNQQGLRKLNLSALAKSLGLSRATLYNHFRNRDELIYRCFRRSVVDDARRLDAAAARKGPLDQILHYVRESLSEAALQQVTIVDTAVLTGKFRSEIEASVRANHERIRELIDEGIDRREIRECDSVLVSRAIPSITSFARLSHRWVGGRHVKNPDALVDFLNLGTAADRTREFRFIESVDAFSRLAAAGFGKRNLADMRIEQILMTGSALMNRNGMDNVTLEDVAESLSATRGSVYHYLKDRQDLIVQSLKRGFELYEAFIEYAAETGTTGLEKASIVSHLNTQAQVGSLQPALAWMSFEVSSSHLRRQFQSRMRKMSKRIDAFAEQGIHDGSRRATDIAAVSAARAGAYMWIPKWIDQVEDPSPQRIADEFVALFNKGLAPI